MDTYVYVVNLIVRGNPTHSFLTENITYFLLNKRIELDLNFLGMESSLKVSLLLYLSYF